MLSNPLIATTLIFALIAFGEWLSLVTKSQNPDASHRNGRIPSP